MAAALRVWLSFLLFYSGCCSDLPWPCPGVCWSHPSETDMLFSTAPKTTAGHGSNPLSPGTDPLPLPDLAPILPKITLVNR